MRDFAERLIAEEARENKSSGSKTPVAFLVCDKLRPHLATFMGKTGFRALLSRALSLAGAENPWLRALYVNVDGTLEGWTELEAQVGQKKITEGGVVLLAQLFGLLAAFIGDNLTLGIVSGMWPKLSLNELNFDEGDKK
jgi:hypothetical protein